VFPAEDAMYKGPSSAGQETFSEFFHCY